MEINKIYNENCLYTMSRMEDNFIDLTVTSPPYDNLRKYNGYNFDFKSIAKELYRVTKPGGVVVWVVGDATIKGSETGTSFKQALFFKECGFNLHDTMIYQKNKAPLNAKRYQCSFEYMFIFTKNGQPKTFNPIKVKSKTSGNKATSTQRSKSGSRRRRADGYSITKEFKIKSNIWFYYAGRDEGDKISEKHPARFPEKLANDHIVSWSNEGDLIYDPFMGSGTTAKMSKINNRNYIGSEISAEYCEIIKQRLDSSGALF